MPDALESKEAKPSRNIVRKVLLGLVIILFLMRLGIERRPRPPELAADCAKPAFKLSVTEVRMGGPVAFTIVGTAGREYAIGVNVASYARRPGGGWDLVPEPGREGTVIAGANPEAMPPSCTRTGYFAVPGPVGKHTVTLFELTERGAVFVERQELEVTET